jgi:hypothetical protein
MATAVSNTFDIGIRAPTVATSSMPTIWDERDTYTRWGWTWNEATANPAYDSAPGYVITAPDVHGETEGDDVWAYLQAYSRRTTGRDGYLQRATAWRNYYVNSFEGSAEQVKDQSFLFDHYYGWGLQEYATQLGDPGAGAEALKICTSLHDWWAAGGRTQSGNWPVAGSFDVAHWGHRGPARNLHTAAVVADATGDAKAIELRDRLIDLWLASPDWQDLPNGAGMYWVSQEQMASYMPQLSYAAGDRAISSFHIGQLAEAFFASWLSPNVTIARKTALRSKILAMATWMRANGLDPTYRYTGNTLGILGTGGAWWSFSLNPPVTSADGSYTISLVNLLVMAYKFTADSTFLVGSPPVGSPNGPYSAQYCFNRGTKNIFGSTTARECPDNVVGHFVDTRFDTSTGNVYLYNNKGELQYTYLIFENGGAPTVF